MRKLRKTWKCLNSVLVIAAALLLLCSCGEKQRLEGSRWVAKASVTVQMVEFSQDGTVTIKNSLLKGESAETLGLTEEELQEALTPRVFYYYNKENGKCFEMYSSREDLENRKNGIEVAYSFTPEGIKIAEGEYKAAD